MDASGVNLHLHRIWRRLLLVVPINDHMESCTPCTSSKKRWLNMQEFRFHDKPLWSRSPFWFKQSPANFLSELDAVVFIYLIFFSCNAGLVLDMVGQLLEMVKTVVNLPGNEKKQNNNTHTTKPQKQHKQQHPQKAPRPAGKTAREICKLGETGETIAPLSPSNVLFRHVVLRHVVHC